MNETIEIIKMISIIIIIAYMISKREINSQGMDRYDQYWGIAQEGRTRDMFGNIYHNDRYDVWANMVDHNPLWN